MKVSEKQQLIIQTLQENLPELHFNSKHWGAGENLTQSTYFLREDLDYYKKSIYYYSPSNTLVHFTTIDATKLIIKNKCIRLYNLNNLNDPREYSYGSKLIYERAEDFDDCKENYYVLSFCQENVLKRTTGKEFNMWRLYGDNGFGAAIKFNFVDFDNYIWKDFFISKVFYGNVNRAKFQNISKTIKELELHNPLVTIDISILSCFHKSKLFSLENEVRLLYDKRKIRGMGHTRYQADGGFDFPIEYTDKKKSEAKNKKVKYIELEINNHNHPHIFPQIPIPGIKEIVLGYNYKETYNQTKEELEKLCYSHIGYTPKISLSRLAKYYHE